MSFLIVGLGNIGIEYADTRHNIGFNVLDVLAGASNISFESRRLGSVAEYRYKGKNFILLKPSTFMNLSGKAVNYWLQAEKIPVENMLVIVDDLALPLGTLRMRKQGSDGGHNGLKDIENCLKTKNYKRVKVGISNNKNIDTKDYVLGRFNSEDKKIIDNSINTISNIINDFPYLTFENLMNKYN